MIHICQDEGERIGRPPVVRDKVLATMRTLRRARVARIVEETGLQARSVHDVLKKATARGEMSFTKHGRYFVFEVKDA